MTKANAMLNPHQDFILYRDLTPESQRSLKREDLIFWAEEVYVTRERFEDLDLRLAQL